MDVIEILSLSLFLYSVTVTIALLFCDVKIKNFTGFTALCCFAWPLVVFCWFILLVDDNSSL